MPNIYSGTINASAPTAGSVGVASGALVAANTNRVGLVIVNTSAGTIYLGINNAAVVGRGISLNANGGTWVMDDYTFSNEAINAIAHTANTQVAVQEFVR